MSATISHIDFEPFPAPGQKSVGSGARTDLRSFVAHASWGHLGSEEDLFARDARGTNRIGAGLLVAVRASRVDVAVASTEGMQGHRFGDVSGSVGDCVRHGRTKLETG